MPGKNNLEELKKQYPEFFENAPEELLQIVLSEETPLEISAICVENGIADEKKIEDIAYHITSVLLGRLPLRILHKALQINSGISEESAKNISAAADRQIFAPVKDILDKIYKEETAPEPKKPSRQDTYREPMG